MHAQNHSDQIEVVGKIFAILTDRLVGIQIQYRIQYVLYIVYTLLKYSNKYCIFFRLHRLVSI